MKLIVGLGNPGKKYERTRHNIGFRILDTFIEQWTLMKKSSALIYKTSDVLYVKPQTFMNLSGAAVLALKQFYEIELEDMLIVYDDKDLPFGTLRTRTEGSAGGHNGMNSIIGTLNTKDIPRLKIGVAPTNEETIIHDTADYVLSNFTAAEEKEVPEIIKQAKLEIERFIQPE